MGVPSIILVLAKNQSETAEDLEAAGVLINLGDARKISVVVLIEKISKLISDGSKRTEMSIASLTLMTSFTQISVVDLLVNENA